MDYIETGIELLKAGKAEQAIDVLYNGFFDEGNIDCLGIAADVFNSTLSHEQYADFYKILFWNICCQQEIPVTLHNLGIEYIVGDILQQNKEKGLSMIRLASNSGYLSSTKYMGIKAYYDDDNITAIEYLSKCLSMEDGEVYEILGDAYNYLAQPNYRQSIQYLEIAATKYNRAFAQYKLGLMYRDGLGVIVNVNNAIAYLQQAAQNGEERAQYILGKAYLTGDGLNVNPDPHIAIPYLTSAAESGHTDAAYLIGLAYFYGEGVPVDYNASIHWLEKAKELGEISAYCRLGQIHYILGNYSQALKELETSFNVYGIRINVLTLGIMYKDGLGCPADNAKAFKCYMSASEDGLDTCEINEFIAECYFNGTGIPVNFDLAFEYYRKAANQGSAYSKYKIGYMATHKLTPRIQTESCLYWLESAGGEGCFEAYLELGEYLKSIGNYEKAFQYYQKAFNGGIADAGIAIGQIYEHGLGNTKKNINLAYEWYLKAANKGSAKAQAELKCFKQGLFGGYKRV
ncbi:SEL1-like repeat protein [Proteiniborus sp.]|uniref:tetratricopeptide repeat protein n=1 Tax=Proteiniborus sp. TaxID=2079015 RepID=UPI003333A3A1